MPGSPTTPGHQGARDDAPVCIAFRQENGVGTRKEVTFAARWLACAYPCRRFACPLAGTCARRGADADRYSFIVVDLHHLLLAGLPAHSLRDPELTSVSLRGFSCAAQISPCGQMPPGGRPCA
jgi:hypothetical protein